MEQWDETYGGRVPDTEDSSSLGATNASQQGR